MMEGLQNRGGKTTIHQRIITEKLGFIDWVYKDS